MEWSFAKRTYVAMSLTLLIIGLSSGCEWTGGGGVDAPNSRYNFVNFSGVYKAQDGGVLVSDYTGTAAVPATEGSTNNVSVNGEVVATGNGSDTAFNNALDHAPVLAGSVTITAPPAFTFTDPNGDGTFTGTSGASGTINYDTGAITLDFGGVALDAGSQVRADYVFLETSDGSSGSDASRNPGSSGGAIFSFSVEQYGNLLTIVDNSGATYSGNMGDIRSSGGVNQDNISTRTVLVGDTFVGSYSASGTSSAGKKVKMVGTFEGVVAQVGGNSFDLFPRLMFGTWIEDDGVTGNIDGIAGTPITIDVVNTTNDTANVSL